MTEAPEKVAFALEVNARFNELVTWVIEHSPNKDSHLCDEDFADVRERFRKIACGIDAQKMEPEPSEGGAQYVNVTPAPWP
jgi:hypothetical protein